jgi:hypothetical protein
MTDEIWGALAAVGSEAKARRILTLFEHDPDRFEGFSVALGDMLLDYSKTNIDREARALLIQLAEAAASPPGATPCSAARRSTPPKAVPSSTRRCAIAPAHPSSSAAWT